MKTTLITALLLAASSAFAQTYSVSGKSDLWLSGAAPGTTAAGNDTLANAAPFQFPGGITGGMYYTFSATDWASNVGAGSSSLTPEGDLNQFISHSGGQQNGIADLTAPINSLIGVFLDNSVPVSPLPGSLLPYSFNTAASLNFASLNPSLNQPFFIGDGVTSSAKPQTFRAPTNATRLFLGSMDGFEWNNNSGAFRVTVAVTAIPEPSTYAALLGASALAVVVYRRRRRA